MSEITIGSIWADNGKRAKSGRKMKVDLIMSSRVRVAVKFPNDRIYGESGYQYIALHRLNKKGGYRLLRKAS